MDFLTAAPYWGILVLAALNAWVVRRMTIRVRDEDADQ